MDSNCSSLVAWNTVAPCWNIHICPSDAFLYLALLGWFILCRFSTSSSEEDTFSELHKRRLRQISPEKFSTMEKASFSFLAFAVHRVYPIPSFPCRIQPCSVHTSFSATIFLRPAYAPEKPMKSYLWYASSKARATVVISTTNWSLVQIMPILVLHTLWRHHSAVLAFHKPVYSFYFDFLSWINVWFFLLVKYQFKDSGFRSKAAVTKVGDKLLLFKEDARLAIKSLYSVEFSV